MEGNGIEIYSDKPREKWERTEDGKIRIVTEPLNIDSLPIELTREERTLAAKDSIPSGTMIGHAHLKVTDLAKSTAFYMNALSLELKSQIYSAAFLSYDGHHHHIRLNTWESKNGQKRQRGYTGLSKFVLLSDTSSTRTIANEGHGTMKSVVLKDPDDINIEVIFSNDSEEGE